MYSTPDFTNHAVYIYTQKGVTLTKTFHGTINASLNKNAPGFYANRVYSDTIGNLFRYQVPSLHHLQPNRCVMLSSWHTNIFYTDFKECNDENL